MGTNKPFGQGWRLPVRNAAPQQQLAFNASQAPTDPRFANAAPPQAPQQQQPQSYGGHGGGYGGGRMQAPRMRRDGTPVGSGTHGFSFKDHLLPAFGGLDEHYQNQPGNMPIGHGGYDANGGYSAGQIVQNNRNHGITSGFGGQMLQNGQPIPQQQVIENQNEVPYDFAPQADPNQPKIGYEPPTWGEGASTPQPGGPSIGETPWAGDSKFDPNNVPHFAGGGAYQANTPAVVGEKGEEAFVPYDGSDPSYIPGGTRPFQSPKDGFILSNQQLQQLPQLRSDGIAVVSNGNENQPPSMVLHNKYGGGFSNIQTATPKLFNGPKGQLDMPATMASHAQEQGIRDSLLAYTKMKGQTPDGYVLQSERGGARYLPDSPAMLKYGGGWTNGNLPNDMQAVTDTVGRVQRDWQPRVDAVNSIDPRMLQAMEEERKSLMFPNLHRQAPIAPTGPAPVMYGGIPAGSEDGDPFSIGAFGGPNAPQAPRAAFMGQFHGRAGQIKLGQIMMGQAQKQADEQQGYAREDSIHNRNRGEDVADKEAAKAARDADKALQNKATAAGYQTMLRDHLQQGNLTDRDIETINHMPDEESKIMAMQALTKQGAHNQARTERERDAQARAKAQTEHDQRMQAARAHPAAQAGFSVAWNPDTNEGIETFNGKPVTGGKRFKRHKNLGGVGEDVVTEIKPADKTATHVTHPSKDVYDVEDEEGAVERKYLSAGEPPPSGGKKKWTLVKGSNASQSTSKPGSQYYTTP